MGGEKGSPAGLDSGPEVTYRFEGETIFSHMDLMHYIYDDLYAYSLGALQGQGAPHQALRCFSWSSYSPRLGLWGVWGHLASEVSGF